MIKVIFDKKDTVNRVGRYLLAAVLLLSGVSKLFYLQGFATEVTLYSELYVSSVFAPWSEVIALLVCCVEIGLGMFLCLKSFSLLSTLSAWILMTFFLYLTGVNYISSTLFGSVESCGCFGELIHFSPKGSFIKTLVLWLVALVAFLTSINRNIFNFSLHRKSSE